jgi:hypothetical protein
VFSITGKSILAAEASGTLPKQRQLGSNHSLQNTPAHKSSKFQTSLTATKKSNDRVASLSSTMQGLTISSPVKRTVERPK